MLYDIAVIGGGAAGLTAAIYAKKQQPQLNIAVFEALDRVGKKLITTGNGRCNITNRYADASRYHGGVVNLFEKTFSEYSVDKAVAFFGEIGIDVVFEDDGRAYPRSYQASSVVDALRFATLENGVEIICNCKITDIEKGKVFTLKTNSATYNAKTVIAATGLLSGGKSVGSCGSFYELLKSKGVKGEKLTPAIVQIKTSNDITKQLKGIKLNADVSLLLDGKRARKEFGEVLFTDYGLSGPPILQVSRAVERENGDKKISLDLLPEYNFGELCDILCERRNNLSKRTNDNFLTGFINKRVGQVILKLCNIKLTDAVSNLLDSDIKNIANILKKFEFKAVGTTGFANSQVTAGGISVSELDDNLECKKIKGLFLAGEVVDIDGDCGGFNLQWAWCSGMLAADSATKLLRDQI